MLQYVESVMRQSSIWGGMARVPEKGPRQVSARNTLTLPSYVMEHLNLEPGGWVEFDLLDGRVAIRKVKWK